MGCMGTLLKLCAVLAPVIAALAALYMHAVGLMEAFHFTPAVASLALAGRNNVLDGNPLDQAVYFGQGQSDTWVFYTAAAKILLGLQYMHPYIPRWTSLALFEPRPEGNLEKFCHGLLGYMWGHPDDQAFSYPAVYADRAAVQDWISHCSKAYSDLSDEEKRLLDPFVEKGGVPMDVLLSPRKGEKIADSKVQGRAGVEHEAVEKLTRAEVDEIIRTSVEMSAARIEPVAAVLEHYHKLNLVKIPRIPDTWEAVGDALKQGRITHFDATKLLRKELFNMSMKELKEGEGEAASRIPIFGDGSRAQKLETFADEHHNAITRGNFGLTSGGLVFPPGTCDDYPEYCETPEQAKRMFELQSPKAGYVHTRRLPKYHGLLPEDLEAKMGMADDILRSQSQLWMGSTPGGLHYDEEANVYVQTTGETFAFLVPQNYTDAFAGDDRHPWYAKFFGPRELSEDPHLATVPIYLLHMKPGDGITLHGRTYHRFLAATNNRIALNWFFIPKWRKMEYTPADWYAREAAVSLERLAIRQLWARSLVGVYEATGKGIIYMGGKLEYL